MTPENKSNTDSLVLATPDTGENLIFSVPQGGTVDLGNLLETVTNLGRDGDNFILTFENGSTLTLEGFFPGEEETSSEPVLLIDGQEVPYEFFMASYGDSIEAAAGPATPADSGGTGSGGAYGDGSGDLFGGNEGLGKLGLINWSEDIEYTSYAEGTTSSATTATDLDTPSIPEADPFNFGDGFFVDESYIEGGTQFNEDSGDNPNSTANGNSVTLTEEQLKDLNIENGNGDKLENLKLGDNELKGEYGTLTVTVTDNKDGTYTVNTKYELTKNAEHGNTDSHNESTTNNPDSFTFTSGDDSHTINVNIHDDGPEINSSTSWIVPDEDSAIDGNASITFDKNDGTDNRPADAEGQSQVHAQTPGGQQHQDFNTDTLEYGEGANKVTVTSVKVTTNDDGTIKEIGEGGDLGYVTKDGGKSNGLTVYSNAEGQMNANGGDGHNHDGEISHKPGQDTAEGVQFILGEPDKDGNGTTTAYEFNITLDALYNGEGATWEGGEGLAEKVTLYFYKDGKLVETVTYTSDSEYGNYGEDVTTYIPGGFDKVIVAATDNGGKSESSAFLIDSVTFAGSQATYAGDIDFEIGVDNTGAEGVAFAYDFNSDKEAKVNINGNDMIFTLGETTDNGWQEMTGAYSNSPDSLVFKVMLNPETGEWTLHLNENATPPINKDFELNFEVKDSEGDTTTVSQNVPVEGEFISADEDGGELKGGKGDDTLTGGEGTDTFLWTKGGLGGTDKIADFDLGSLTGDKVEGEDRIDLKDLFDWGADGAPDMGEGLEEYLNINKMSDANVKIEIDKDGYGKFDSAYDQVINVTFDGLNFDPLQNLVDTVRTQILLDTGNA